MHRRVLDAIACPECDGELEVSGIDSGPRTGEGSLRCVSDGLTYPIINGIPRLVRRERTDAVEKQASAFSSLWMKEGWGAFNPADLPYVSGPGSSKWRVKARSMEALFRFVDRLAPRRIVDLGCGNGWLSRHLAARGFETYGVEIGLDDVLGLGAASELLRHELDVNLIWGEMDHPPFRTASVDAVICNASLHYATSISLVIGQIARIVRPGGALVVMNSPVHQDRGSALRAQTEFRGHLRQLGGDETVISNYHHFQSADLKAEFSRAFEQPMEMPFEPGRLFRFSRRLKGMVLGMELASFPILCARRISVDG